jgi:hypothetical protein
VIDELNRLSKVGFGYDLTPTDKDMMILAVEEIERLRWVLGGVRNAIKTGRDLPLQVWLDQINIALEEGSE